MKSKKLPKKNRPRQKQKSAGPKDLKDLQHEELSGIPDEKSLLSLSSTDEDEGSGDGNIGRSKNNILGN